MAESYGFRSAYLYDSARNRGVTIRANARFGSMVWMLTRFLAFYFSTTSCSRFVKSADAFEVPKPTETQARWLDYEVGAIVHFNMQTFDRTMRPGKQTPLYHSRVDLSHHEMAPLFRSRLLVYWTTMCFLALCFTNLAT